MKQYRDFRATQEYWEAYEPKGKYWDLGELLKVSRFIPIPKHNDYWGRWTFNERNLTLYYNPEEGKSGYDYEIDLEEIFNRTDISNWLSHLQTKDWVEPEDLGNLSKACRDIFGEVYEILYRKKDFDPSKYLNQRKKDRIAMEKEVKNQSRILHGQPRIK